MRWFKKIENEGKRGKEEERYIDFDGGREEGQGGTARGEST